MQDLELIKYPRTHHIEGSRLQPGDEDLDATPFEQIHGRHLVVEEKMDGANAAISFAPDGKLMLQSRGHYLTGGAREKHFNLLKQWAHAHTHALWSVLKDQYIMYGEWLYARHTIFYNRLPHYFMEFDVLDKTNRQFLSTARRHEMLADLPVTSVKVIKAGRFSSIARLIDLVGSSFFIQEGHLEQLRKLCENMGLDADRALSETDPSQVMEGLYIKVEEDGVVKERYKYVRASFLTTMLQSNSHWLTRPIIPNQLAPDINIFAPRIS